MSFCSSDASSALASSSGFVFVVSFLTSSKSSTTVASGWVLVVVLPRVWKSILDRSVGPFGVLDVGTCCCTFLEQRKMVMVPDQEAVCIHMLV